MITPDLTCPTTRFNGDGEEHTVSSANVAGPDGEGIHDCRDCGMWFLPEALAVRVVGDEDIPPGVLQRIVQRTSAAVDTVGGLSTVTQ